MISKLLLWCATISPFMGDTITPNYEIKRMMPHTVVEIPIVFHIVYKEPWQNVTNAQVLTGLNHLNNRFNNLNNQSSVRSIFRPFIGNAQIIFCLAQYAPDGSPTDGITRRITTRDNFNTSAGEWHLMKQAAFGTVAWPHQDYVNVWIVDLIGGGIAGYALIPTASSVNSQSDGIVLDFNNAFLLSQTILTHEMGHYFGLRHVWGASTGCGFDDGIDDTPRTSSPNYGCLFNANSCNDPQPIFGNADAQDQVENYMDYGSCSSMFTGMQVNLMRTVLNGLRSSLLSSNGCTGISLPIRGLRYSGKYDKGVKIEWEVEQEINTCGYRIYRSGVNVGYVDAGKNKYEWFEPLNTGKVYVGVVKRVGEVNEVFEIRSLDCDGREYVDARFNVAIPLLNAVSIENWLKHSWNSFWGIK